MPRDRQAVHRRLQQAAMELFGERGYDQTTASEIAARAGVTERTFFRHFEDKRDILFEGEEQLQSTLTEAILSAPADLGPMQVLLHGFHAVESVFEQNREFSAPRHQVIAATPTLREREAGKMISVTAALALALEHRGIEPRLAMLAAQAGAAAFAFAVAEWLGYASGDFGQHLESAFFRLRTLFAAFEIASKDRPSV